MQNFTIILLEVITVGKTIFITETSSGLENINCIIVKVIIMLYQFIELN
ncbi:hypothetical protein ACIQAA_28375 [Neobacillus sp. NPDC093182]